MNPKVVMTPERSFSDSARDRSATPRGPRSLFFRALVLGASRVLTRGDLRTVMTSETVPVEQPGALVDELWIRDRAVETGYVERTRCRRKTSDEGRSGAIVPGRDSHRRPMGGCWQDQVLPDTERPPAVSTTRCADDDGATRRARRSEGSLIRTTHGSRAHTDERIRH